MEIGIPMGFQSPTFGELVFNDISGSATGLSGDSTLWPTGLESGVGYILQRQFGLDGAPIRNPVTNRPHKSGGIVHKFRREARVFGVEGIFTPPGMPSVTQQRTRDLRVLLEERLKGAHGSLEDRTGRFFLRPSGQATRFMDVRAYNPIEITYDSVGGPFGFVATFVAADSKMYDYVQDYTAYGAGGGGAFIPNDGNTESWGVFKVHGPSSGFVLEADTGFKIDWTGSLGGGSYIEIDMFKETMYNNGDEANRLGGLDLEESDFFPIPVGGAQVTLTGAASFEALSNNAWV